MGAFAMTNMPNTLDELITELDRLSREWRSTWEGQTENIALRMHADGFSHAYEYAADMARWVRDPL